MDRGAWQATVHGVAQSRTRLKRLSTRARAQAQGRNNIIHNRKKVETTHVH